MDIAFLINQCAPTVHADTMQRIVRVESSFNPYAIGVVGARLQRQPASMPEALSAIRWLDANGYNYSVGLSQVNKTNFKAHGLTPETALQPCPNLKVGSAILTACFLRARRITTSPQSALRAAFSCYESGNFLSGFKDGYVQKIISAASAYGPSLPAARARSSSASASLLPRAAIAAHAGKP